MTSTDPSKPTLTVLVGAGASVPLGIPSTSQLTELVKTALLTRSTRGKANTLFQHRAGKLLAAAERYYGKDRLNFEHLLDLFEGGHALAVAWTLKPAVTISEACLTKPDGDLADVMEPAFLDECIFALRWTILEAVTGASKDCQTHPAWSAYRSFWTTLAEEFTLTVVTLNYDTLVEQSIDLDGSHQGLAPVVGEGVWRLDPTVLLGQAVNHRLLHLHGGIQFGGREYGSEPNRFCYEDSFHDLYWHATPKSARQTMWGSSAPRSGSGRMLEGGPIVTGLHKPDKLLIEPLASYYVETANQLQRCPRLLVLGYGFGDPHVNAILTRMTRNHGGSRRVALVDLVNMVEEYGSNDRDDMLVMVQRWSQERFEIDYSHPYPWCSKDGCARFYFKGLLDAAEQSHGLVSFLKT